MFRTLPLLFVCAGILLLTSEASAQSFDPLTPKTLRSGYVGNSGAVYQNHASDHARILYQQGSGGETCPKEVVQEQTQAIRVNSQAATKAFAKLQEAHPENKEVKKHVELIQQHHEKVLAMCNMLDEAAKKADAGGVMVCECCKTMVKDLDAAAKEAEKLRITLKLPALTDPLQERPKTKK